MTPMNEPGFFSCVLRCVCTKSIPKEKVISPYSCQRAEDCLNVSDLSRNDPFT